MEDTIEGEADDQSARLIVTASATGADPASAIAMTTPETIATTSDAMMIDGTEVERLAGEMGRQCAPSHVYLTSTTERLALRQLLLRQVPTAGLL